MIEGYIRREIRVTLQTQNASDLTGITCLADGADTIFAEVVSEMGGRLIVIVPATTYRDNLPAEHHSAYDQLYNQANEIYRLAFHESSSKAHMQASRLLTRLIN